MGLILLGIILVIAWIAVGCPIGFTGFRFGHPEDD